MEILDWDEYCNLEKVKYFESQKKTVYKENLRVFGVGINDVDFKVVLPINGKPQSPASYSTWKNICLVDATTHNIMKNFPRM